MTAPDIKTNAPRERVLVTGGAGYVGSLLIPRLLDAGYRVRVLDSLVFNQYPLFPYFIDPRFEFIKADIRDEKALRDSLKDVQAIIHLAAIVGEPACKRDPGLCEDVNLRATELLNNLRTPEQKVIFASTGNVYGRIEGICTEESPVNPVSGYAVSKLKGEQAIAAKGNYVVYRFPTAFGLSPRLRLDLMVNDFVYRALKDRLNVVYEAKFKRAFVHVVDIARSYLFALEHFDDIKNAAYNVGSEELNFTKEEIAKKILEKIPYHLHFADFGTDPDQRNYDVSYAKIRGKGFTTTINLDQGIDELIRGCRTLQISNPFLNYPLNG